MSGEKVYQPNVNNKAAAEKRRERNEAAAKSFARTCKDTGMPKTKVLTNIKANYGLSTHDARAIYKSA